MPLRSRSRTEGLMLKAGALICPRPVHVPLDLPDLFPSASCLYPRHKHHGHSATDGRHPGIVKSSGRGTLYVPLSDQGMLLHLAGSLKRSHVQFRNIKTYDVEIRTLDEAGLAGVRFVKADVEGGERERSSNYCARPADNRARTVVRYA